MSTAKINVCITDDHRLVRKGIASILSFYDRIGEITEAENGIELIKLIKKESPHVILLDLQLPLMSGIEVCRLLNRDYPEIKIVILSMNDSPETVELLMRIGAHGFLSKGTDSDEVAQAIYEVYDRGYYNNDLIFKALQWVSRREACPSIQLLSKRELEIIQLICEELSTKEIGQRLCISEKTVQNHRANIMEKLGVHNTAGILKFVYQNLALTSNR